ncbi:hypothetical protein WOLCODRAFT_80152, partial [Wolfiporia cocos MD-104 SS10]
GLRETRRHRETVSVDLKAVEKERQQNITIYNNKQPKDNLNIDESSLFGKAPPDRGLATKQMSGKKANKERLKVTFMCSATGNKFPLFFIGKSKQPCCFGNQSPKDHGFYYWNNKTSWMTSEIFEE